MVSHMTASATRENMGRNLYPISLPVSLSIYDIDVLLLRLHPVNVRYAIEKWHHNITVFGLQWQNILLIWCPNLPIADSIDHIWYYCIVLKVLLWFVDTRTAHPCASRGSDPATSCCYKPHVRDERSITRNNPGK